MVSERYVDLLKQDFMKMSDKPNRFLESYERLKERERVKEAYVTCLARTLAWNADCAFWAKNGYVGKTYQDPDLCATFETIGAWMSAALDHRS